MSARQDRLKELFAQNNRRRNVSELRRKAKELGILAELCADEDVNLLQGLGVFEPIEKLYPTNWDTIQPRLINLLAEESDPVRLAPYNFQEFGFLLTDPAALAEALDGEPPFQFDLDGFWVVGSFGAICVDFDDAEPEADVLWLHYPLETTETNASN